MDYFGFAHVLVSRDSKTERPIMPNSARYLNRVQFIFFELYTFPLSFFFPCACVFRFLVGDGQWDFFLVLLLEHIRKVLFMYIMYMCVSCLTYLSTTSLNLLPSPPPSSPLGADVYYLRTWENFE